MPFAGGVNAVKLKPVLRKIETDRGNLHGGRLLSFVAFSDDPLWHIDAGERTVSSIRVAGSARRMRIRSPRGFYVLLFHLADRSPL